MEDKQIENIKKCLMLQEIEKENAGEKILEKINMEIINEKDT